MFFLNVNWSRCVSSCIVCSILLFSILFPFGLVFSLCQFFQRFQYDVFVSNDFVCSLLVYPATIIKSELKSQGIRKHELFLEVSHSKALKNIEIEQT